MSNIPAANNPAALDVPIPEQAQKNGAVKTADELPCYHCLLLIGGIYLLAWTILRVGLHLRVGHGADNSLVGILEIYGLGLAHDLAVMAYLIALPALALLVLPGRWLCSRPIRYLAGGLYFAALFTLAFDLVAEWVFWDEFGVRFNFIAVDYLVYTHEIIGMVQEAFPLTKILLPPFAVALGIFVLTFRRFDRALCLPAVTRPRLGATDLGFVLAPVLAYTLISQPRDEYSVNEHNNQLGKNGLYCLVEAFKANRLEYDRFYRTEDPAEAFRLLRTKLKAPNVRFIRKDARDITRKITASGPEQKRNVIIMVVESFSASFLGVLGNPSNITPNLDRLSEKCLFFRNLYATGTRTVRGLEAVTMSLPPTPGRSLIKRPDNANRFNLGTIFRQRGYDTTFFYPGYGYFDNMNSFFCSNGFSIVDRFSMDKDDITFSNIMGVCDGDMFRKILQYSDASFEHHHPFFSLFMTVSNHMPYTYPDTPGVKYGKTRRGAVMYTDHAIGEFLRRAESHPWFKNTVFVIVADHCASSAGKTRIPVRKYHIPCFMYAPGFIAPRKVDTLCSQMDIGPTLLGLLHFSYQSSFFGQDVLARGFTGRALPGNYEHLGFYSGNVLTVLMPRKQVATYKVTMPRTQIPMPEDREHTRLAIAYYQCAAYMLR